MRPSIEEVHALLTAPGERYEIAETTLEGAPIRFWKNAPPDLARVLRSSAAHGDETFIVYEDERISFAEHFARAAWLSHRLREDFGVRRGDRVAIAMRNLPEWPVAFWAIAAAGGVVVPLNAWWTGPEMEFGLADSTPRALVCDAERLERIAPYLDGLRSHGPVHVVGVRLGPDAELPEDAVRWEDAVADADVLPVAPMSEIGPEDDICIFYTSGTTGRPKGAVLTHRGAASNLLNLAFWQTMAGAAQDMAIAAGDPPAGSDKQAGESYPGSILAVPLFHVATGVLKSVGVPPVPPAAMAAEKN